jgi:hypothetical protein
LTGSTDTLPQVRLHFPGKEAAIAYAERQGLPFEVRESTHPSDDLARHGRQVPLAERRLLPEIAWAWEAPHLILDKFGTGNVHARKAA